MPRTGRMRRLRLGASGLAAMAAAWMFAACLASLTTGDALAQAGKVFTPSQEGFRMPDFPPGVVLNEDIASAKAMRFPWEFMRLVRAEGPWDFRWQGFGQVSNPYETSGHFHYGIVSNAIGLPGWLAKRAAAVRQVYGR